jgi:HEAT repeat protein
MSKSLVLFLIGIIPALALPAAEEQACWNNTSYHLMLHDYPSACASIEAALQEHPVSQPLLELAIKVYAAACRSQQALALWHRLEGTSKDRYLELVAWSFLEEGLTSSAPLTRISALIGAAANRGRCSPLVERCLDDECSLVRMIACQLAGKLQLTLLIPHLIEKLAKDHSWQVRCACSSALGDLRAQSAQKALLHTITHAAAGLEERQAAAEAIACITAKDPLPWITWLVQASAAPLRLLACEVAIHNNCGASSLEPLLKDPNSQVQAAALQAFGLLYPGWKGNTAVLPAALHCLRSSSDSYVAISAGWLLTICNHPEGLKTLVKLVEHPRANVRSCAAAALAAAGHRALPLLPTILKKCRGDLAPAAAIAIGLLGHRVTLDDASASLLQLLAERKVRWRWQQWGIFRFLTPFTDDDTLLHDTVDSATRLELLNLLAITHPQDALPALQQFLLARPWGVSAAAAFLLLTESAENALELIQQLQTTGTTPQQRLQATLVLALWGHSTTASTPLQAAYHQGDRTTKERILTALGYTADACAKPLLIDVLSDPSSSLRLHAATALLQILSH